MSETPQKAQKGAADAARGLPDKTSALVRREIAAAQREMLAKAMAARGALSLLGAAGFFGVLSAAATYRLTVRLLEKRLSPATAASVAAAGYGVAAGAAGAIGVQRLRGNQPLIRAETLSGTVKAAADRDATASDAVWTTDLEVDEQYESLFREMLTYMTGAGDKISAGAHLLFAAKNFERVGDHATNIAEELHFKFTGEPMSGSVRPKA